MKLDSIVGGLFKGSVLPGLCLGVNLELSSVDPDPWATPSSASTLRSQLTVSSTEPTVLSTESHSSNRKPQEILRMQPESMYLGSRAMGT